MADKGKGVGIGGAGRSEQLTGLGTSSSSFVSPSSSSSGLQDGKEVSEVVNEQSFSASEEDEGDTTAVLSPSQGAVSLLDHEDLIENPFASDAQASIGATGSTSRRRTHHSMASIDDEEDRAEGSSTPTASSSSVAAAADLANIRSPESTNGHFSVISLSSHARNPSRDTGPRLSESIASRVNPMDKRASTAEGLDKLRENFERLHQRQILRQSISQSAEVSTSASASTAATIPASEAPASSASAATTAPSDVFDGVQDDDPSTEGTVDWDFWGRVMSNYQDVAQQTPQELSRAIQNGIPAQLRGLCWQLLSASKDEEMEIIYAYYIRQTSTHEKQIKKDLSRTFPEQEYFKDKGIGQDNLFNVVKAYSLYDEECGYCQGMQFIVGPLLLNMPDEEAFSTLVRLMKSYGLRGHFTPNMPGLQLRLFQFDRLLEDMLPLLHRHLLRSGIKVSMYASQWFMTLFSYRFPLELVYRVLDSVFAEGIEAIFRFAVALMEKSENDLLELNFEQTLAYLKGTAMFEQYRLETTGDAQQSDEVEHKAAYDVDRFARDAYAQQVTPYMLDGYASEFQAQVKAAHAHRMEVEALRVVNRNLSAKVVSLEEQIQQLSAEHVDLVKEAVMSKIAKEEMEEELIRYKVLFAEASLRADQSSLDQSNQAAAAAAAAHRASSVSSMASPTGSTPPLPPTTPAAAPAAPAPASRASTVDPTHSPTRLARASPTLAPPPAPSTTASSLSAGIMGSLAGFSGFVRSGSFRGLSFGGGGGGGAAATTSSSPASAAQSAAQTQIPPRLPSRPAAPIPAENGSARGPSLAVTHEREGEEEQPARVADGEESMVLSASTVDLGAAEDPVIGEVDHEDSRGGQARDDARDSIIVLDDTAPRTSIFLSDHQRRSAVGEGATAKHTSEDAVGGDEGAEREEVEGEQEEDIDLS